ncbi:hypothetical protein [Paenibacillus sp. SYP-B4298]|nr:hypothetical protein [Paenibacillus sp. SYP-B4298]
MKKMGRHLAHPKRAVMVQLAVVRVVRHLRGGLMSLGPPASAGAAALC